MAQHKAVAARLGSFARLTSYVRLNVGYEDGWSFDGLHVGKARYDMTVRARITMFDWIFKNYNLKGIYTCSCFIRETNQD